MREPDPLPEPSLGQAEAMAAGRTLTARDHKVIALLGKHRVLAAEQLVRVTPQRHRARHRLVEL